MRQRLVALAAGIVILTTGCGGNGADALAAKACTVGPPGSAAGAKDAAGVITADQLDQWHRQYSKAADLAAKAAKADDTWLDMARAYSTFADMIDWAVAHQIPAVLTDADRSRAADLGVKFQDANDMLRSECRRALAE
jgi:hypothetical protein